MRTGSLLIVYALTVLFFMVYVDHKTQVCEVNGEQFGHVGMMEYKDNGTTIYVPIFKRMNK